MENQKSSLRSLEHDKKLPVEHKHLMQEGYEFVMNIEPTERILTKTGSYHSVSDIEVGLEQAGYEFKSSSVYDQNGNKIPTQISIWKRSKKELTENEKSNRKISGY